MRILHTSDWHLGCRLYSISRRPHIRARLQEIAAYLDEHRVDVMVVAGDVFHKKHHRADELQEAVEDMRHVFRPFLQRGGTMIAISGNHDHEALFTMLHTVQDLAAPVPAPGAGPPPPAPGGRLYLGGRPGVLRLESRGEQVQFVLLPYPTVGRYLEGEEASVGSTEERNALLQGKLSARLAALQAGLDPRLPRVLVSHTHVKGGRTHHLYEMDEKDDVIFSQPLSGDFAYAAYGHIHLPQALPDTDYARYSGSIERLNKDERGDDKSVVLVEVTSKGRSLPATLPLRATPVAVACVLDPEVDLPELGERYPDPETLLYYTLDLPPEMDREAVHREVRRRFKNAIKDGVLGGPLSNDTPAALSEREAAALSARLRDFPSTVRRYLEEHLGDFPQRERALALVSELIAEEEREVRA